LGHHVQSEWGSGFGFEPVASNINRTGGRSVIIIADDEAAII